MITELVYFYRDGDEETLSRMLCLFEKFDHKQLLDSYLYTLERGVIASHGQALNLLAMRIAFLRRFKNSPILFEDNCIISLKKPPFSLIRLNESLVEEKYKTDREFLSQLLFELRKYGEIKSEEILNWWLNKY